MLPERIYWIEPLEEEELAFLRKKEVSDRAQFYKTITALMVVCFLIPFGFAWVRALNGESAAFSYPYYFMNVGLLLALSTIAGYISYRVYLWRIQRDIHCHTKTIERAHITRKMFMPHTNTYFFYIDSPTRLSIEVTEPDYHRMESGDEVNIEYTTYSKMYLGYF